MSSPAARQASRRRRRPNRRKAACRQAPDRGRTAAASPRRPRPGMADRRAGAWPPSSPATAASRPESTWLMVMTRRTGTPDIAAARALAPAARIAARGWNSGRARKAPRRSPPRSAAAAIRRRRSSIRRKRRPQAAASLSGTALVRRSASRPKKRLALASVTTKLLTPVRVMTNPFTQPSAAPRPSAPPPRPEPAGRASLHQIAAHHHGANADRADGKVHAAGREHHICAKPMTISIASARPTVNRLNEERKPGAQRDNSQKTAMIATSPSCADKAPILTR